MRVTVDAEGGVALIAARRGSASRHESRMRGSASTCAAVRQGTRAERGKALVPPSRIITIITTIVIIITIITIIIIITIITIYVYFVLLLVIIR